MSDERGIHRSPRPRPRPLAELPEEALGADPEQLASLWAIAMIRARPLADVGEISLAALADDGPALCAQAVRALGSDIELDRLTGHGTGAERGGGAPARKLGVLAGASDALAVVAAVEALRGVLWQALLDALSPGLREGAGARGLADAVERLACVCAEMLSAALAHAATATSAGEPGAAPAAGGAAATPMPSAAVERRGAVIVDERAEPAEPVPEPDRPRGHVPPRAGEPAPASARRREVGPPREHEPERSREVDPRRGYRERSPERPWSSRHPSAARSTRRGEGALARVLAREEPAPEASERARQAIEIHDTRGEEGPAAWVGSIGRELELFRRNGVPFAVLLVEPLGIELLRTPAPSPSLRLLDDELQDALALALGVAPREGRARRGRGRSASAASLTRERAGRYWLLAPDVDQQAGARLADRLARAVLSVVEYRGEPLRVIVGAAFCPDDGTTAPALAAHADLGLYAARSAARGPLPSGTAVYDDPA